MGMPTSAGSSKKQKSFRKISISALVTMPKPLTVWTLESPLDCKEIQPVNPKGNHPLIFIGKTDTEAETPILWPPDAKN